MASTPAPEPNAVAVAATAMLDAVIAGIEEQRDALADAFAHAVANGKPRTCTAVSRDGEACDRLPAHDGICSFDFDATVRRYRDFEETAARVPRLESQVSRLTSQLMSAQRQMDDLRKRVPPGHL
jgi:hypothetical protein